MPAAKSIHRRWFWRGGVPQLADNRWHQLVLLQNGSTPGIGELWLDGLPLGPMEFSAQVPTAASMSSSNSSTALAVQPGSNEPIWPTVANIGRDQELVLGGWVDAQGMVHVTGAVAQPTPLMRASPEALALSRDLPYHARGSNEATVFKQQTAKASLHAALQVTWRFGRWLGGAPTQQPP